MNDPGYVNYQDSRLQPPEDNDEPQDAAEYWVRCVHGDACASLFMRLTGKTMADTDACAQMGCEDCDEWED